MNELVVTIVLILIPGIIATVICDRIAVHSKWGSFKFGVYSIVLGVFSYLVLQIIYYVIDIFQYGTNPSTFTHLIIWKAAYAKVQEFPVFEVIFATAISFPVAFLASFIINHKLLNRFARAIGITFKYGDENIYSYYLNTEEIDWVYVRDRENDLTYQGRVWGYSETEAMQELVLSEVTVFRYQDSKELYSMPFIYITKGIGKFVIEAVYLNDQEKSDG